ncbi:MAG: peptidoglycan DD-metalloendopeptidase family protein [Myxococcota bacterium]
MNRPNGKISRRPSIWVRCREVGAFAACLSDRLRRSSAKGHPARPSSNPQAIKALDRATTFPNQRAEAGLGARWAVVAMLMTTAACATLLPPAEEKIPSRYLVHRVGSGETIYSIARTYEVDVRDLIRLNNMSEPDRIYIDDELLIPIEDPSVDRLRADVQTRRRRTCKNARGSSDRANGLLWPLDDSRSRMPRRDVSEDRAVTELSAPTRTPVWASASGKVSFADTRPGVGWLVAIDHKDLRVMTLYSGELDLCVSAGTRVRRGQVIALLGRTVRDEELPLTFEVRDINGGASPSVRPPPQEGRSNLSEDRAVRRRFR